MSQAGLLNVSTSSLPPSVPTSFTTDSGVAVPVANNLNIVGGEGIDTSGAGATVTISGEDATAGINAGAANKGIASFDSAMFTVTAGFVQLAGGGIGLDAINVDAATAPGTDPVVPDGAGQVTITGAQVANGVVGTNVIRTDSLAANSLTIEVQRSTSSAGSVVANNGVSHFDSSKFTVDSNGFVSTSGTGIGQTITGDSGGALSPTSGNWNILGGPGITTSGSGSTLTINSVVFTDTTATTLAVDNGYNATAAGTYNMPATAAQGELIIVYCDTAGAVVLDCPALNFIRIGSLITSSGGTATSTSIGDSLTLRYRLSTLTWEATSVVGTWLIA